MNGRSHLASFRGHDARVTSPAIIHLKKAIVEALGKANFRFTETGFPGF